MKKYLAVLLIALMAVSIVSTAGVLTASKAAAEDFPAAMPIQYESGKTYTFTPAQFNFRGAGISPDVIGTPKHHELTKGAKTLASIETTAEQAGEVATVNGVHVRLVGADPATDLGKPCTVTLKVGYSLYAVGDANTRSRINIIGTFHTDASHWASDEVRGDDAVTTKSVDTQTYTFTSTLGDVFGPNLDHGVIHVNALASQWQPGAGAAITHAQVSRITITFD